MAKFDSQKALMLIGMAFGLTISSRAELLNLEGILQAEHDEQVLQLRMEHQQQQSSARRQGLPISKLRRLQARQLRERIEQSRLHQRQLRDQRVLRQQLRTHPRLTSRASQYLQMQRFQQEQAVQQLHFKLLRDFGR